MGRWLAGAVLVMLLSGCTPGATPPPDSVPPVTTAPTSAAATPTATPTPAVEPSTPASPACDFLPPGVDPRACEVAVASAPPVPESTEFPGLYVLSASAGRIRCDVNGFAEFAACAVSAELSPVLPVEECDAGDWDNNFVYLWKPTGDTWEAGQGSCRGDPLTAELAEPPALPEGSTLVDGDLALLATPEGIVVWNGAARHGFAIVDDRVLTW